jgi:WD40 repeat protein
MLASPEWCPPDRRDFAWHYFGASCRVERFSVEARANGLNALAVAKNGQLIVVGGANGSVVGFTPEGKQAFRFDGPHKGLVSNVAVTVDGKNAISASTDGVIRVGSVDKHGPMRELGKLEEPIYALAVTPDGTVFAGGGRRTTGGKIAAWDLATGARKPAPPNERGVVRSLAVAPDGDTLLVGLDGGEVLRWSIAKSTPLSRFRTQLLRVQNLAVRSDGMIAVVGPTRSEVSLWDGPTGRKLRDIATARGVWSVQFSPEGHTVAVGEHGNQVSLWRVSDGQPVRTLYAPLRRRFNHTVPILAETTLGSELPNLVVGVGFAAEDLLVTANADDRVSAWALDTSLRAIVNRPSGLFGNELIPLDDGRMAIISANDRKLYRADLTTGEMAPIVDNLPKSARLLVQSIDRKSLYLALGTGVAPKQVVEWTVQARQFPDLAQHFEVAVPGPVTSLLPRPEGLMIVCRDGNVYEWRHNLNEQPVARWSHPEAPAYGAYLAASNRLVTLSAKESIVWPEGRRLNAQFPGPVRGVEACPDGKTLAVWVYDPIETRPRIYLWDAGHDSPPYEIDAAKSGIISVAFSPDGRTLGVVGADHLVRLVNVATRETLLTLADDKLFLRGLVFAPDGKSISTMRLRNEPLETRIVTWRIPDK